MPSNKAFKNALITGASSGLGSALARQLAERGTALFLTGRNAGRLRKLADELRHLVTVDYIACDLIQSIEVLLQYIHEHTPDLVINNAGYTIYGNCLDHLEEQEKIVAVNALRPHELTLYAARSLLENKQSGVIVNISSAAAFLPFPMMASYAAAKAFISSFSQSFDAEMRPFGIRILVSLPGPILTSFAARASQKNDVQALTLLALSTEKAAALILDQIDKRKGYAIIDWRSRLGILLSRCLPKSWVAASLEKEIINRIN